MNVIHKIALDLAQNNYIEIEVAKGSENTIVLQFFFLESGKKYDMSEVGAVSFKAITPVMPFPKYQRLPLTLPKLTLAIFYLLTLSL